MTASLRSAVTGTRWAFDVATWKPTETQWLFATSCLQVEEHQRISRFAFQRDAKSSLIGRLMMRKFVAEHCDIPYDQIRFKRDERGKPFLAEEADLSFNVSHQGNYAVLAGEPCKLSLGVDVMKLEYSGGKSLEDFFRVMTRNFSSTEWLHINEPHDDNAKLANFCRHWCLKESYVKATGSGITVDLRRISFEPRTRLLSTDSTTCDTRLYVNDELLYDWSFHESLLDAEHCVAVAMQGDNKCTQNSPVSFKPLSFEDLIRGCKPLVDSDMVACENFFHKPVSPR